MWEKPCDGPCKLYGESATIKPRGVRPLPPDTPSPLEQNPLEALRPPLRAPLRPTQVRVQGGALVMGLGKAGATTTGVRGELELVAVDRGVLQGTEGAGRQGVLSNQGRHRNRGKGVVE